MQLHEITENKEKYMPILLLADEQEDMVLRYLHRGRLFLLVDENRTVNDGAQQEKQPLCTFEGHPVAADCVVTEEGESLLEIKNLAVDPLYQKTGLGRKMIEAALEQYHGAFSEAQVGTGDSPLTVPFYEKCGFRRHHIVENFFTDNYDHPIWEEGILLKDMVYLRKALR